MAVIIKKVDNRKLLKAFITFPEKLYKNEPNWVPATYKDEFDTLGPKNPAFKFCESEYYLAYKDGKIAGRIAAIINHNANKDWDENIVRFGWCDFIDDGGVLKALIDRVIEFGKVRGCVKIKGPLGFTDMDKEGLLVEGYEHLSPFTCLWNYPYYVTRLEELGFVKDADWTQSSCDISSELPPMFQYAPMIEKRFGIHVMKPKNNKELEARGYELFHVLNEAFAGSKLYEFTKLNDEQINCYVKEYLPMANKDFICVVLNEEDKLIGFAITIPSLSKAIKKGRGRLFPFGWYHLLQALKHNDTLEALMIGVLPEYQGKGASVLIFKYLHENCIKYGINKLILNPQLEDNFKVQSLFGEYNKVPFMRRRSLTMDI